MVMFLTLRLHFHFVSGYRIRGGSRSRSPVRRRNADHHYRSDFDHSAGFSRSRGFGGGREPGRYRDSSPPYARARGGGGGRPFGRGFNGPSFGPGPFRGGGGMAKNNPNVRPREGDWFCPDPSCGNLNFARRDSCNNCNRYRPAPGGSPPRRGAYSGPPPLHTPRRFSGPPLDRSPIRTMNGYRSSPPRSWARDGPREFGAGGPPPHLGHHHARRDRPDYPEEILRERSKFDRPVPPPLDWGHGDRGREDFFNERKGYERRLPSPPPPPPLPLPPRGSGRWGHDGRERSRSPMRSPIRGGLRSPIRGALRSPIRGALPLKDFRRDIYMERERDGRDERRGGVRDRVGDAY